MQTRKAAAKVMLNVLKGASLADALPAAQQTVPKDSAFLQALCYGTCRWYFALDAILATLLDTPLKAKDEDIHQLLLIGLWQLLYGEVPPHAAVKETVAAVPRKKPWAKSLVNAILRRCLREPPAVQDRPTHPDWWIRKLKTDWPHDWETVLLANNQHPPLTLRVNLQKISRDDYLETLANGGMDAVALPQTESGIQLSRPVPVSDLPLFQSGHVSVQDAAAQLAAPLLAPGANERVLDACAAPGGKTTHLLEWTKGKISLLAIDKHPARLAQVTENLQREGLHCTLKVADARRPDTFWDGQPFDRILLDAPCSASGVVRRHPDIRLLRREKDIPALAEEQYRLLVSLWPLLKPGGILLYATCSVFREENVLVVSRFLSTHPEAKEQPIKAEWGRACEIGRQILPGEENRDGFYYALLQKMTANA